MKLPRAILILTLCFVLVCIVTAKRRSSTAVSEDSTAARSEADVRAVRESAKISADIEEILKEVCANVTKASQHVRQKQEQAGQKTQDDAVKPLFALVIDDMGFNYKTAERISSLGLTATWAVIPGTAYSSEIAALAEKTGNPFILHIPMQAVADSPGSGYAVGTDTDEETIRSYLSELKKKYPQAIGVNNHRGSKATSDRQTMQRFMKLLAATGWNFLDSRTIGKTIAYKVAKEYHIPVVQNGAFIDGSPELETMKVQFSKAVKHAQKYGSVVAICHAREKTLAFLHYLTQIQNNSVAFVTLDQLWKKQYVQCQKEDK